MHEVSIPLRNLGRPGCSFGYGIEAVEPPDVLEERTIPYPIFLSAAEVWGERVGALRRGGHCRRSGLPCGRHSRPSPEYGDNLACLPAAVRNRTRAGT